MNKSEESAIREQYKKLGYLGETHKRSWAKSIVWRIIGVFILGGLAYTYTGDWEQTTWITLIFHAIRTVLYWGHERLWDRIDWGRKRCEPQQ